MKGNKKVFGVLAAILAAVLMLTSLVNASAVGQSIGVDIMKVVVNGAEVTGQEDLKTQFLRGDSLDIIVVLNASQTQSNVEAEVFISGDEHHSIAQKTETFDVEANTQYQKSFSLKIPSDLEQDNYKLRIMITDRYGAIYYQNFNMKIDTKRHDVIIKDVDFNPNTEIKSGRSFTSVVRVENTGEKDEDSVKVTMQILSLGLSVSDYIDNLAAGDKKSSEELYLRVPDCTKAGQYDVTFTVKYDDDYSESTEKRIVSITEGDSCGDSAKSAPDTTIVVGNNFQNVPRGAATTYDVTIANSGKTSKTYTLALDNVNDWATTSVTPSNVLVVGAGETKTAVISLTPGEDAAMAQKTFTLKVSSADQLIKEIPLIANVQKQKSAAWDSVKLGLEIGLVLLALVLVVLGAVILIKKFRESKSDDSVNTEEMSGSDAVDTYY